ncbi:hypothetical protein E2C01_089097 [Portunus trituberculatus]|uniref:Uncharacterized protein n=1 Tax=Portunus trituberculatus TaxID=210409 RepID=A0A5B7JGC5_PORTR|nr:hypothetical protein [Portunus trituberculatus]
MRETDSSRGEVVGDGTGRRGESGVRIAGGMGKGEREDQAAGTGCG